MADHVGAGALKVNGLGLRRDHATDQRRHFHRRAVVELESLMKGMPGMGPLRAQGRELVERVADVGADIDRAAAGDSDAGRDQRRRPAG